MDKLQQLVNEIKEVKEYLVKVGPQNRYKYIERKVAEAKELKEEQVEIIELINKDIAAAKFSSEQLENTKILKNKFNKIFEDIVEFGKQITPTKMDFDLKTAVSLLNATDESPGKTLQLIDSIELYSSMLNDNGNRYIIN